MGDPEKEYRLTDKLKAVTSRNASQSKTVQSGFEATGLLKRPSRLEPLQIEDTNGVTFANRTTTNKTPAFVARHGSQAIDDRSATLQAILDGKPGGP